MIVLMGVAGSGKSMQGRLLADERGFAWISAGEVLRLLVTGQRRQEMLEGKLLSDDEVIQIMDKVLDLIDTAQDFVIDGFPRTTAQADWIFEQSEKGRFPIRAVFNLEASQEVVQERLMQRARQDDTPDAIASRFREYEEVTKPILQYFEQKQVPVFNIDAEPAPLTIHDEIIRHIDELA